MDDLKLGYRISSLKSSFESLYGAPPDLISRAPGRVNLIGEHIDYSGFSVVPMAIEQCTLIAARFTPGQIIQVANVIPDRFAAHSYESLNQDSKLSGGQWSDYVACGLRGVSLSSPPPSCQLLVDGRVPMASGLSSSSALVCASGLVGAPEAMPREELAEKMAAAERTIGVSGGGMDQAISLMATQGTALHISFNPLRSEIVRLPENVSVVLCNSGVEAAKFATATTGYNLRVVECRLAALLLAKELQIENVSILADLVTPNDSPLEALPDLVRKYLKAEPYTRDQLSEYEKEIPENFLGPFFLRQRALHVFEESLRVESFVRGGSAEELGKLMNASHMSLKTLFECSCFQLDQLTSLAQQKSFGSRLTGAGWGGWTVSLVASDSVDGFIAHLKQHYYNLNPNFAGFSIDNMIIVSRPSQGGNVIR